MLAGVAASLEIRTPRTPRTQLNTQLSGGGYSIRQPQVSICGGKRKLTGEFSDVSAHDVVSAQWHQPLRERWTAGGGAGGGPGGGAGFSLGVSCWKRQQLHASDEELWSELRTQDRTKGCFISSRGEKCSLRRQRHEVNLTNKKKLCKVWSLQHPFF